MGLLSGGAHGLVGMGPLETAGLQVQFGSLFGVNSLELGTVAVLDPGLPYFVPSLELDGRNHFSGILAAIEWRER